ncbi:MULTISPECIES: serine hydrolase [unclassified Lentimicrobium]|uniref:serine hydrolase domain-containing protein n=1 Tax=unclassified Lentimicrobium TaxID=2677434 RepID=UPI00155499DE|nr:MULTISPECIES: serine hydrolase domain-containing protein [unclassified Lentimicrobium]NPD48162.1 beta-lactamase family protein [Lentimicrobium sp. S6]NPD86383.1 beta-lactamase family protein [Lentimicrobium sp. L6]
MKNIKIALLSLLFLVFLTSCLRLGTKDKTAENQIIYSQSDSDLRKSDSIQNILTKVVNDGQAPGMIAAIISGEGVIAIASAGERKAGSGIAFTANDVVHLGSCGKAMTATMIATLVAEGKLSWDMKLIEAIPDLKNNIHPDLKNTTLWQLLTHRAGIQNDPIDWYAYADMDIKERRFSILKDNIKLAPAYTDGEFHYSNFGYVVAACMAEQITGLSWETLMRERLFGPLGMTTAGFGDPVKNKSIDQPWGHKKSWLQNKWKPSRDYYGEVLSPAGRVHCSVEDWAKFISLQLPGENTFLDRIILNKLIEPNGVYAGGWVVFQETEQPWAKGIVLVHGGSNEIWYAAVMVAPNLDRAYVIVTNSCDFGLTDRVCVEMTNKIAKMDQVLF